MDSTFKIFSLVAVVLALAPMASADNSVPAGVLPAIQQFSSHPAASRDSYDRYEDALDRVAAYVEARPGSVVQAENRSRRLP